jgi:hypothetical protein
MRLRADVEMMVTVVTKDGGAVSCTCCVKEKGNVGYDVNTEARLCSHCWQWTNTKYYVFRVCVCSLSFAACIAHAPFCPAVKYFSKLSHKRHDFRKKQLLIFGKSY